MTSWLAAAEWIAPAATMIAAMMTAANAGARTTGWGFVVFTAGSVGWAAIGASTGLTSLLATNAFLTLVNLVGIWRWLGRQAKYQDGAKTATERSEHGGGRPLVPATGVSGLAVQDRDGARLGSCVEALIGQDSGTIEYIVVASRNTLGLDEELRGVVRADCEFGAGAITLTLDAEAFARLPVLADRNWPARL
jgi:hypothetical protein